MQYHKKIRDNLYFVTGAVLNTDNTVLYNKHIIYQRYINLDHYSECEINAITSSSDIVSTMFSKEDLNNFIVKSIFDFLPWWLNDKYEQTNNASEAKKIIKELIQKSSQLLTT